MYLLALALISCQYSWLVRWSIIIIIACWAGTEHGRAVLLYSIHLWEYTFVVVDKLRAVKQVKSDKTCSNGDVLLGSAKLCHICNKWDKWCYICIYTLSFLLNLSPAHSLMFLGSFRSSKNTVIVSCNFCPLVYHLDCLSPPLTNPPQGSSWMCPSHAEHAVVSSVLLVVLFLYSSFACSRGYMMLDWQLE